MIRRFLILLIRFYQVAISPYFGRCCRFQPTCSEYARQALILHGLCRGSWLAITRLLRCHPFCHGGYDPVPPMLFVDLLSPKVHSKENASNLASYSRKPHF